MHQEPSKKKDENPKVPVVFITPYEHHSNISPWEKSGFNVKVIDSDAFGNLNFQKFSEILTAHITIKPLS